MDAEADPDNNIFVEGKKIFELPNHLGNNLVTITDRKIGVDLNSDGIIDYYEAEVANANDYYPFGMLMPGRKYSANGLYRYGFNGKENDNDVKGEGNSQDYGMRIYDPRMGRFLSVDPLIKEYPWYTPYSFAGNKVIQCIDLDGEEDWAQQQKAYNIQQAKIRVDNEFYKKVEENGTISYEKRDRLVEAKEKNWKTKWKESHNIFAKISYSIVNGFYTTGQQLSSSVTRQEYVQNIGGGVYETKGPFGENERTANFVNAATAIVPGAPVDGVASKVANNIITKIEEQATEQVAVQGKKALVQANRVAGNAFRDELANLLTQEGRQVSVEVFKKTPFGARFIDIEVSQGGKVLGGIETKVGGSRYLPLQRLKDLWLHKVQGYPVNLVKKPLHW